MGNPFTMIMLVDLAKAEIGLEALSKRPGTLSSEKLEAMTAVCSVGLDRGLLSGDTPVETPADDRPGCPDASGR